MKYRHIFGPVSSHRLGRSLGIDLIPYKTCSYNCVYCECGETTNQIIERSTFIPEDEVMNELRSILSTHPDLDSVTFAGSGEPTLSLSIGNVIAMVKDEFPGYTISVLTNGSLLSRPDVRSELLAADRVIPTLTSAKQETFEAIHRPHASLSIDAIIKGMEEFRREYRGEIWLEVFIIPGINTTDEELTLLRDAIEEINPDRVQLNTLDRPAPESWVEAASEADLNSIRDHLGKERVEMINLSPAGTQSAAVMGEEKEMISAMLSRRPSTIEDIITLTGMSGGEVAKILRDLEKENEIRSYRGARGTFYSSTLSDKADLMREENH
ncbi:radical SAM protein [Methanocalculus taiwanensis]|uniref:Radical SAM protein n=1 Tax=Methanocalculus taiwanensis TaxID=106207 RepID=A0ABD4TFJ9_9EURY|nr:radical SAM protein [Methanocalculus taiwanensis]MCQ1537486.1 radical SAM protein [Methanocalculus taiwanensis]